MGEEHLLELEQLKRQKLLDEATVVLDIDVEKENQNDTNTDTKDSNKLPGPGS
jgi:hypothetical protein